MSCRFREEILIHKWDEFLRLSSFSNYWISFSLVVNFQTLKFQRIFPFYFSSPWIPILSLRRRPWTCVQVTTWLLFSYALEYSWKYNHWRESIFGVVVGKSVNGNLRWYRGIQVNLVIFITSPGTYLCCNLFLSFLQFLIFIFSIFACR